MPSTRIYDIKEAIKAYVGVSMSGYDTEGNEYDSLEEMWMDIGLLKKDDDDDKEAGEEKEKEEEKATLAGDDLWYSKAADYWEEESNCPATVDGVLGGFGDVSGKDIQTSQAFLAQVKTMFPSLQCKRALDCGAGIGRVTKHLLLPEFDRVDLLEQSPRLIGAAGDFIGEEASRLRFLCLGMQNFKPKPDTYDLIWIQWCVGHLHDVDLLDFLRRMKAALKPGGMICLKDNCCEKGVDFVVDKDDSSLTRSAAYLKALFKMTEFECWREEKQEGFPEELFPVIMFAFAPTS